MEFISLKVLQSTLTRPDLKDTLHVRRDAHLLRELRALREERRAPEVVDLEDRCTGLGRRSLHLRRVDLDEAFFGEVRPEKLAHSSLNAEDGLRRR